LLLIFLDLASADVGLCWFQPHLQSLILFFYLLFLIFLVKAQTLVFILILNVHTINCFIRFILIFLKPVKHFYILIAYLLSFLVHFINEIITFDFFYVVNHGFTVAIELQATTSFASDLIEHIQVIFIWPNYYALYFL
jgi:hypothetical protein